MLLPLCGDDLDSGGEAQGGENLFAVFPGERRGQLQNPAPFPLTLSFSHDAGSFRRMSTITAILEPDADGTLHLPLPAELRHGKVRVEAKVEAVETPAIDEEQRKRELLEIMERIRARNPFKNIADPVAWQREMREDVVLPGRE